MASSQAIFINGQTVIYTESNEQYAQENNCAAMTISAIDRLFVMTKRAEMKGGSLYVDRMPTIENAVLLLDAQISKLYVRDEPVQSDEIIAAQFLQDHSVFVDVNPEIIFKG